MGRRNINLAGGGDHIPDFYSPETILIIGWQSTSGGRTPGVQQKENKIFGIAGIKVIYFWNNQVTNNIKGVILAIIYARRDESSKN